MLPTTGHGTITAGYCGLLSGSTDRSQSVCGIPDLRKLADPGPLTTPDWSEADWQP